MNKPSRNDRAEVEIGQDGCARLSGALTFRTTPALYRETGHLFGGGGGAGVSAIDLSGVTEADSAGLALLLEWKARAQDRNEALSLINPPEHLLRLAALGEATELLGLVGETSPKGGTP